MGVKERQQLPFTDDSVQGLHIPGHIKAASGAVRLVLLLYCFISGETEAQKGFEVTQSSSW